MKMTPEIDASSFRAGAEAMRKRIIDMVRKEAELPGFPPLGTLIRMFLQGPIENSRHWIRVAKNVTIKHIEELPIPSERNEI
jgi:hypothetical protein